jgi:hypothetical protein
MNYDTVLPDRLRAKIKRQANRKPLKLVYKIGIVLLLLVGLRHLNTVPHREWYKMAGSKCEIHTVEELFGSSYRGAIDGKDLNVSSKDFSDIWRMMPLGSRQ